MPIKVLVLMGAAFLAHNGQAQNHYVWSYAFDQVPNPMSDAWGTTTIKTTEWSVHRTIDDMAYVQGYHGVDSPGDTIGLGATLGQPNNPSRVTIINKTAAPTFAVGDSLTMQFVWRPAGGTFDPTVEGHDQNQILQFGLLRNPSLTGGNSGIEGAVGTFGGAGYSFLGDGTTDALYLGATQVGKGQIDISLDQGNTTFTKSLDVAFGIYNEYGTKLIDLGTHTLGIHTISSISGLAVYSFNLTFNFTDINTITIGATFDQYVIPNRPDNDTFADYYTGFSSNLGSGSVAFELDAWDNLYVGMGHTIADYDQVALSGSSYDGFSTQDFVIVPEPGSALLTLLSGVLWLGLRRRR